MATTRLSGAYAGYEHQDALVAIALATLLLPSSGNRTVTGENKVVPVDKFDDIEITGTRRIRVQIKSHATADRHLNLSDFTTAKISFRIDEAVRSFAEDATPADEYRLFTTFEPPEEELSRFLQVERLLPGLLPGIKTLRYRLDADKIWPIDGLPNWRALAGVEREDFIAFCHRFVVETGCPVASSNLRIPSLLEQELFTLLGEQIGIGLWPNHNRRIEDAAAMLLRSAMKVRTHSLSCGEDFVIDALALRIDYGRVPETLPVIESRVIVRDDALAKVHTMLQIGQRIAVVGSPGVGKSWLLHQMTDYLRTTGWSVAMHYCFIDLLDRDREARVSLETLFGSLIAQVREEFPALSPLGGARFAASAAELERL